MKQRITEEQLFQLTRRQIIYLHYYWFDKKEKNTDNCIDVSEIAVPLLTIGDLIEFFVFHELRINMDNATPSSVRIPKYKLEFCEWEFVDTLWEAARFILAAKENE